MTEPQSADTDAVDKVCPTCGLRWVNWTPAFDATEDTRCKFCGVPMILAAHNDGGESGE